MNVISYENHFDCCLRPLSWLKDDGTNQYNSSHNFIRLPRIAHVGHCGCSKLFPRKIPRAITMLQDDHCNGSASQCSHTHTQFHMISISTRLFCQSHFHTRSVFTYKKVGGARQLRYTLASSAVATNATDIAPKSAEATNAANIALASAEATNAPNIKHD